ncbi:putative oxidoreductase [Rosellinia necatrix]|uniref:Putative oxidoreductase n=1 Tax=Rosellinia necatrix TaxID=77044 RepID=A0A1W2TQH5_ROSNE|nr:putative oxidoreductase [Rosellinia necatrix]
MKIPTLLLGASLAAASYPGALPLPLPTPIWTRLATNSSAQFRGLAPVSSRVAWVSGTGATVLRTTDGGATWASVGPRLPAADAGRLEFRDVEAWSADRAVVLSIGAGGDSRVYATRDGGASWALAFANADPAAFYDCLAFATPARGLALGDPVGGRFRLLETRDGGASWEVLDGDDDDDDDDAGMPPALDGEYAFAASGTCISAAAGRWYIASGGVDPGRVFRSADGRRWSVSNSSIAGGPAAGVFSVRFRDATHGIAVGGNYESPTGAVSNAAWSADGGRSWTPAASFPHGYRSGAAWVQGVHGMAIAVGTTGSDFTLDSGRTWHSFDNGTFDSVECVGARVCWASGQGGRVARLSW